LALRTEAACLCDSAGDVITVTRCNGGDDMDAASGTLRELDHPGTALPRQTPRSQAQPISGASNFYRVTLRQRRVGKCLIARRVPRKLRSTHTRSGRWNS
jgi:hypothetical protein